MKFITQAIIVIVLGSLLPGCTSEEGGSSSSIDEPFTVTRDYCDLTVRRAVFLVTRLHDFTLTDGTTPLSVVDNTMALTFTEVPAESIAESQEGTIRSTLTFTETGETDPTQIAIDGCTSSSSCHEVNPGTLLSAQEIHLTSEEGESEYDYHLSVIYHTQDDTERRLEGTVEYDIGEIIIAERPYTCDESCREERSSEANSQGYVYEVVYHTCTYTCSNNTSGTYTYESTHTNVISGTAPGTDCTIDMTYPTVPDDFTSAVF